MIQKLMERLDRLSRRERILVIAVSLAVAVFLIQRLVVRPVRSHLAAVREEIALRGKEIQANARYLNMRSSVVPRYEQVLSQLKVSGNEEQGIAEMLHEVEKLGSESEVTLSNLKPKPVKAVEDRLLLSADLEAECSMVKLLTFLYNLQQSEQLFRVSNLNANAHEKDPDLLRVSMTLTQLVVREVRGAA